MTTHESGTGTVATGATEPPRLLLLVMQQQCCVELLGWPGHASLQLQLWAQQRRAAAMLGRLAAWYWWHAAQPCTCTGASCTAAAGIRDANVITTV